MKTSRLTLFALLASCTIFILPSPSQSGGRVSCAIEKHDEDGDGKISRDEWRKSDRRFEKIDVDGSGYISLDELGVCFDRVAK